MLHQFNFTGNVFRRVYVYELSSFVNGLSFLQALFHVPSFVNWLLDDKKHHMACEKMSKYGMMAGIFCGVIIYDFFYRWYASYRMYCLRDV